MKTTVSQIQRTKPGLCLPGNAEETLGVFAVVNQLQNLLLDLEKVRRSVSINLQFLNPVSNVSVFALQKVPALFTPQPLNPAQSRLVAASEPPIPESSQLEAEVSFVSHVINRKNPINGLIRWLWEPDLRRWRALWKPWCPGSVPLLDLDGRARLPPTIRGLGFVCVRSWG